MHAGTRSLITENLLINNILYYETNFTKFKIMATHDVPTRWSRNKLGGD